MPDILDEALWNLDWLLTMQDPADGGVYHKLTNLRFDGIVMPHAASTTPRYVVAKSTAAALDFAATMATALVGSFGEVRLGRHDTALKMSQGKIDLFSDYEGDIKVLWKGENRTSNSVSYFSPSFSGFSAQLTYIAEDDPEAEDGISAALLYGDENLKDSTVYAALAYDADVAGYDTVRASAQVKVSGFKLGAMYQTQEATDTGLERDGYLFSVAYPVGKFELKGQYQAMEDDNGFSAGADYKLGKNTKLFAWYSSFDFDTALDSDYLAVGLEHKF